MRIAVLGANGRSGEVFVRLALQNGHQVNAGVFGGHKFTPSDYLKIINCDATNTSQVEQLISGCDAVVSLIGHVKGSPADIQTKAMKSLVLAMQKQKIKRVVSLTGTGVRQPGDKITLVDRFLNLGVSLADPKRVSDGKLHFDVLKNSQLDWTVLRVLKLQNTKPRSFELKLNGPTKIITSREEVAQSILQVLEESSFIKAAPIISH